jgi:hypothetical protein
MKIVNVILWVLLLTAANACTSGKSYVKELGNVPKNLKINQIQVLGTHNSYSLKVDPRLLQLAEKMYAEMMQRSFDSINYERRAAFLENHPNVMSLSEMLNYEHPTFEEQLNAGIRGLEIDIYHDPTGNRFNNPAGYAMLRKMGFDNLLPFDTTDLSRPGFKVLHMADIDFRTHYTTLKSALQAIKNWSDANPQHLPIFIMIEAKNSGLPKGLPGVAEVLDFDEQAYESIEKEMVQVLGRDKIITPDQVRGNYPSLREAVLAKHWPILSESLGKVIFLLLPATGGGNGSQSVYTKNRPNLEGRIMFVQSDPDDSFGAFLLLDNAIARFSDIQQYVKQGYLVRTRADIDTYEAKHNLHNRADSAFMSGAQVVSTDFFRPGNFYGTEYFVKMPGGTVGRLNPVNGR